MTRTYHQHAAGTFSVNVLAGTPHCGLDDQAAQFRYVVDIAYADGALDHNGFLLDNTDFQRYFDALQPVGISCERLADAVSAHFFAVLADRHVRSIVVRINPFGDVYVQSAVIA